MDEGVGAPDLNRTAQAIYACRPEASRGRLFEEPVCPMRSPFQRDRDRIIHSTAFRRLTYKTQVFIYHEGDHYRTRLTHSLEVAQIARTLARLLGLNEDLAEALALAHDLGHSPFGHAGERALHAMMIDWGGFDHNAQSLRIVTGLENKYASFDGLNLSWESLEGLVKHNGPLLDEKGQGVGAYLGKSVPEAITNFSARYDLELHAYASAEAQVAALADDIAYNNHDIDDGLRAGLISSAAVASVPLVASVMNDVASRYPDLEDARSIYEINRRLITVMVNDVAQTSTQLLENEAPQSADDVRKAGRALISFSTEMTQALNELRVFLREEVYRHPKVSKIMKGAEDVVKRLFEHYLANENALPPWWRERTQNVSEAKRARRIADFVAGMTDRFAIGEFERLFDETPELR